MTSVSAAHARRVVSGLDETGRSAIVADGLAESVAARPGGSIVTDLWRLEGLPARLEDGDGLGHGAGLPPPIGGAVVRLCTFPPDAEMDMEAFEQAMRQTYGPAASGHGRAPGMHRTDTVDVITVLSGELCAVMESGEAVLGPGDTFVQRGTWHAWRNRGEVPATIVAVMIAATG
jgi:mannose-6-phosphate isomerase-like protein (cupin superfamily)